MVSYSTLGMDKQLNEIVMAGSHDAAITEGAANAQTQDLDILGQANAGVRIFDIRITGMLVEGSSIGKASGLKFAELAAYHGKGIASKKSVVDKRLFEKDKMKVKPMTAGTYGITLEKILKDARSFVEANGSEFLLLKFDKCHNWSQIAQACVELLGDTIYKGTGNINLKTLDQLKGKVVVLFSVSGRTATGLQMASSWGILAWQNLSKGGAFDPNFDGLQYFGGGGTQPLAFWRTQKTKLKENFDKQRKKMQKGAATDANVMGMMYWTSTGLKASIKARNDFMWSGDNYLKLMELWGARVPASVDPAKAAAAPILKQFMPNFVMIDFASPDKCQKIYDLNMLASARMTQAYNDMDAYVLG